MEPHHHHEHSHRLTSLNKAFIIGIALNITFVIVEFGVGFYYPTIYLNVPNKISDIVLSITR